ncbi:MAG: NAD(P)H-dependent oxidoreductase subunit E [Woeseiaceae bacterium]|jgi:formate dehydrogenase subunit gamma|nr:NAD(P)H-dependent oxidoreductase subunit E [Woeseiaceae bacterium]
MSAETFNTAVAGEIIARHGQRPERLVQILVEFVRRFGHVPGDAVPLLAAELNLSRAEIHGVVSYYHDFRTTPPARHVLKICQAEACRAMGAERLAADAERLAGIALGETGDALTIEPVYCLGNCALGPAAMFDGKTLGRVDAERLEALLGTIAETAS